MVENADGTTEESATARSGPGSPARRAFEAFAALLDGPLTGLAPWIVLAVLEGPGRLVLAAGVALAISVLFLAVDLARGRSLKLLGVVDVVFFGGLVALHFALSPAGQDWMETWIGEIANVTLFLIAVGSMAVRRPFTLQYAREEVDEQYWADPQFLRVNQVITGAWALAFLVAAVVGSVGDAVLSDSDNMWTAWVLPTAAIVCALQFTQWYSDVARARGADTTPPQPVPGWLDLLAPLTTWLVPIGIVTLVLDGAPTWVGIAFIVAGVASNIVLRNKETSTEVAA